MLIEKWDEAHNSLSETDPVELLDYLMKESKIKATDLANELEMLTKRSTVALFERT